MINVEILEEKGFKKITYEEQDGKPIFYSIEISDQNLVSKLHKFFREDEGSFDFYLDGIKCTIEITESFNFAQYVFKDSSLDYWVFDEIDLIEFENALKLI
ncbi:hypothetical protein ACFQZE_06690 [Paenibacillus sp. GCM10027627]|uniref:hypothetical protein n=1 Tax=unclassified Paenibacillus TaxID=185978 RepID=UPI0036320031